jgi:hypothetical protein
MKKTDRKNKTGLTVNWPKGIFTIDECHKSNPDFVNITLRVRIKNAITDGSVNELGYLHNGKGRPCLMLVHGPITQEHVAEAKSRGVILKSDLSVNVMNIATTPNLNVNVVNITANTEVKSVNIAQETKTETVSS